LAGTKILKCSITSDVNVTIDTQLTDRHMIIKNKYCIKQKCIPKMPFNWWNYIKQSIDPCTSIYFQNIDSNSKKCTVYLMLMS